MKQQHPKTKLKLAQLEYILYLLKKMEKRDKTYKNYPSHNYFKENIIEQIKNLS